MKHFTLLIIAFFLAFSSCNSSHDDVKDQNEFVEEQLVEVSADTTVISFKELKAASKATVDLMMKSLQSWDGFYEYLLEYHSDEIPNLFFDIDFNNDGLFDVVYYGPSGAESNKLILYLNQNGRYEKFYDDYGYIVNLVFVDSILNTMYTNVPGCCADHSFLQKEIRFALSGGEFHHNFVKTICSYEAPDYKNAFANPKRIEINATPYYLRHSPNIDNDTMFYGSSSDDDWTDWLIIGNRIGTLKKGDKGTALAYEKDKTGREWWFVILDADVRPKENFLEYAIEKDVKNFHFSGWVSSRYILVLD
jgi:hypothetical protein